MDSFLWRALAAGLGVAVVAAPLGAFIVWRRMAYFGDTLAHSALLGVALGLALEVGIAPAVLAVCVLVAVLLALLQRRPGLTSDALLGVLAHGSLAFGLVAVGLVQGLRVDLMSYLFGDVLAVTASDLVWVYGGGGLALLALVAVWRPLVWATLDEELARVEGVWVDGVRLLFMLLVAVVVALGMKLVGILLVAALMIIPAAAARRVASTPEQMAVGAALVGCVSVLGGLWASLQWDTPAGPSIVATAAVAFVLVQALPTRAGHRPS